MRKIAQLSALVLLVAVTTAGAPSVPGASLVHAPLAIIEGGTVRTLPKGVRARRGKVIVLRGKPAAATAPAGRTPETRSPVRAKCDTAGRVTVKRETAKLEPGLRVVVIGPDGQARVRYL